ncbi:glycosyltransferase family 2 protein [Paenibacillus sp. FSL R10-2771]|uniref:glycosyltransferase family 2 protein n=1 Tax=Paenibacillus sp. FSL R10-2771 TaxID=2954693 RepID=UPI0030F8EECF
MISVIMPTFNRAKTIQRSIDSVLKQTYQNLELIIVDDNSTDNTIEIIKSIPDDRIKLIAHAKNKGASAARNTGIQAALGDYIAFQDSDDEWIYNKLDIQIKELLSYNVDVVSCAYYQHKNGKIKKLPIVEIEDNNIFSMLLYGNFIGTPSILGKRECFINELFDERLPRFQDWDLMLRLAQKCKIHFINDSLMNAYVQTNSLSENHSSAIVALEIIMGRNIEALKADNKAMSSMYKKMGIFKMKTNDFTTNYYHMAMDVGGFDWKILIRLIEFTIRKKMRK